MSASNFIPVGRTSVVKKSRRSLHVQTEYANYPNPRITTTVSCEGQVVHKVERGLDQPVSSLEEQQSVEGTIRQQHSEILSIVEGGGKKVKTPAPLIRGNTGHTSSIHDRLSTVPGVRRVYRLDNEGRFLGAEETERFREGNASVYKNLRDLIGLFERIPGIGFTRRKGTYEVERNRLYLVSAGLECYFIEIGQAEKAINYEQAIKSIVSGNQ
jgi:hypothetical protein